MPEGDTLHRIARALVVLEGQTVHAVTLPRQAGRGASLTGAVVDEVQAVGKNLLITFDTGLVLHTHLMMNGIWHLYVQGERWRRSADVAVAVIAAGPWVAVCFSAPVVRLVERKRIERELMVAGAHTDLLAKDDIFDLDEVIHRLRERNLEPLGVAIMDQRAVGGIGNVYKSEGLFRRGFDPFAPVIAFSEDELRDLMLESRALLRFNVERNNKRAEGTAVEHYRYNRVTTISARRLALEVPMTSGSLPASRLPTRTTRTGCERLKGPIAVYGRQGQTCFVCGTKVQMQRQGEARRSTYFCDVCQPMRTP